MPHNWRRTMKKYTPNNPINKEINEILSESTYDPFGLNKVPNMPSNPISYLKYKSKKKVLAAPMNSDEWVRIRGHFKNHSNASVQQNIDGYIVCYQPDTPEAYYSWSPKSAFEKGYDLI